MLVFTFIVFANQYLFILARFLYLILSIVNYCIIKQSVRVVCDLPMYTSNDISITTLMNELKWIRLCIVSVSLNSLITHKAYIWETSIYSWALKINPYSWPSISIPKPHRDIFSNCFSFYITWALFQSRRIWELEYRIPTFIRSNKYFEKKNSKRIYHFVIIWLFTFFSYLPTFCYLYLIWCIYQTP